MLPYFLLGIALLAVLILTGSWFARADPRSLAKVFKRIVFALIAGTAIYLILTGRLDQIDGRAAMARRHRLFRILG